MKSHSEGPIWKNVTETHNIRVEDVEDIFETIRLEQPHDEAEYFKYQCKICGEIGPSKQEIDHNLAECAGTYNKFYRDEEEQ